ncbi:SGNH/GDSL hydrolase family protein [Pseudidiomarina halophila]|uniref:SGNH/GDSL hydrolase family protein n=1 Tax=Pseudidiomarina halophila TaxID=1449799 RepID=UPI001300331A|nr:SGNH/GDSL hydrolase family protein [Pseudidiomarina halophila]
MHKLFFAIFAPLLLLQGKRVRARTPRLPEAEGARAGFTAGAAPAGEKGLPLLRVLVLGDSAAAGVGCARQEQAVLGQWVAALSEHAEVEWQLVAKSSLTCAQVLKLLRESDLTAKRFDQVLVSVGVNDVTRRTAPKKWQADLAAMTAYLTHQLQAKHILYTALPPMHKFPALPQPLRWLVGEQAKQLNNLLKLHCRQQSNTYYLAFEVPYESKFIAADGYHPSAHAAALWAQTAAKVGFEETN